MTKQINAEVIDNRIVRIEIPYKSIYSITSDIDNLFKHKDEQGNNIGARGDTIELCAELKRAWKEHQEIIKSEIN